MNFNKVLTNEWTKMPYWYGNPDLDYHCWGKKFKAKCVYVAGKEGRGKHSPCYRYTGRNQDGTYDIATRFISHYIDTIDYFYSITDEFSGSMEFELGNTPEILMKYIDFRYKKGILLHGRSLTDLEKQEFKTII